MKGLYENFHELTTWSLAFRNLELEKQYRCHIQNLSCEQLNGSWGIIAVISCLVMYIYGSLILTSYWVHLQSSMPGALPRVMCLMPFFIFNCNSLWRLLTSKRRALTADQCEKWAFRLLSLLAISEAALSFVHDYYSRYWGCEFSRFRCPYAFSSPTLALRFVAMDAVSNFFIMPSLSIPWVFLINLGIQIPCRLCPFLVHGWDGTSLWVLACVCIQSVQFLQCRYDRELSHRRKFILQLDALGWQERLQKILDGMVPPCFQDAAHSGASPVQCTERATVLFCSFPKEGWLGQDPMTAFKRLHAVYREFDVLVAAEPRASKVEHVGNDYVIVSRIFGRSAPAGTQDTTAAACDSGGDCVALAALAQRMMSAARAVLGDGGIELRAGLASGPVFAAIVGRSRRFVRGA